MAPSHFKELGSILNFSRFDPVRSIHLGRARQPGTRHDDLVANLCGNVDLREKAAKKVQMLELG
jgi:hypothetical protein